MKLLYQERTANLIPHSPHSKSVPSAVRKVELDALYLYPLLEGQGDCH